MREADFFYLDDVERSIDQVMVAHPEVFDFNVHAPGASWPGVRDMEAYHQYVVQALIAKGYCAIFDSEEIQVKKENRFSEHYDITSGTGTCGGAKGPTAPPAGRPPSRARSSAERPTRFSRGIGWVT